MTIREPKRSEAPACRMLLPETGLDARGRNFWLALEGNDIAAALSFRDDGASLSGLRLHVVPPRRRKGIGARLIEHAVRQARLLGRKTIEAAADLHVETAAGAFLGSQGFEMSSRLTAVNEEFGENRMQKWRELRKKLAGDNPLPPSARVVGIDEAPMAELVALYAEHIAHVPNVPGLRRSLRLEQYRQSLIVLVDGKIAGALLAETRNGVLNAPAWIVAPEYRGRHMGLYLRVALLDAIEDGRFPEPFHRLRYEFLDTAPATAKVFREGGYVATQILARFELIVPQ